MTTLVPMTDRARRVLELASDFARESDDRQVAAEHLLFGLVAEGGGVAAMLMKSLGVDAEAVRSAIQGVNEAGPAALEDGHSIEQLQQWAYEELTPLGHNYVGTEHLLLSLTHVVSGRALPVLGALSLDRKLIRDEVYSILGHFA